MNLSILTVTFTAWYSSVIYKINLCWLCFRKSSMHKKWFNSNYQPRTRNWIGHVKHTSDTADPGNKSENFHLWESNWTKTHLIVSRLCLYITSMALCQSNKRRGKKKKGISFCECFTVCKGEKPIIYVWPKFQDIWCTLSTWKNLYFCSLTTKLKI